MEAAIQSLRLKLRFLDMHSNDFFRKDANTALSDRFISAGSICSLSTNCEQVLEAARETFISAEQAKDSVEFSMRFWVEEDGQVQTPWPKPYVRGLGQLVFAGFDARSSVVVDLHTLRIIGRFSGAMAADTRHWKTIIFPMLLSIVSGTLGLVELHASCVVKDGMGLMLAGPSRSGKSTLAMALAQLGFQFLSDDRIFCSMKQGELTAWGLPRPLKLRPEAAEWFDDFRGQEPNDIQNGERVFHFEPKHRTPPYCRPRMLVFLERQPGRGFSMTQITKNEAWSRIEEELLAETNEVIQRQKGPLDQLLSLPPCLLRYGGTPSETAPLLANAFSGLEEHQLPPGGQ